MVETELEKTANARPALAVGHVELYVRNVRQTAEFLVRLGARPLSMRDELAIVELRGGTHLVVMQRNPLSALGVAPAFDLMVDDVEAARKLCEELGIRTSSVKSDRIHSWFHITEPSGTRLTIMSSHAGTRPV